MTLITAVRELPDINREENEMHYAANIVEAKRHLFFGDYAQIQYAAMKLRASDHIRFLQLATLSQRRLTASGARWVLSQPYSLTKQWSTFDD